MVAPAALAHDRMASMERQMDHILRMQLDMSASFSQRLQAMNEKFTPSRELLAGAERRHEDLRAALLAVQERVGGVERRISEMQLSDDERDDLDDADDESDYEEINGLFHRVHQLEMVVVRTRSMVEAIFMHGHATRLQVETIDRSFLGVVDHFDEGARQIDAGIKALREDAQILVGAASATSASPSIQEECEEAKEAMSAQEDETGPVTQESDFFSSLGPSRSESRTLPGLDHQAPFASDLSCSDPDGRPQPGGTAIMPFWAERGLR